MKVMVIVKASSGSEAGEMPSEELLSDMGKFNEALVAAGIMESGEGLKPSCEGYRVRFSGSDRSVIKGPFAETNELLAGYWVWNVDSMDHALEWVKKCPNPMMQDSEIEIRPFFEMEDFSESDPSGKISEQEDALRHTLALQRSQLNNYLFFDGCCEEALTFYQQHLGAKLEMLMRFSDAPEPLPEGAVPAGFDDKIMHCSFRVGDAEILASDGCGIDDSEKFGGFSLALTVPTQDDARTVFAALSQGGTVKMPLEETFWSPLYGQLIDKFGVGWMVMVPDNEPH